MSASLNWKRRIGAIYKHFTARKHKRSMVLIYHSVGGGKMSTDIARFAEQMAWLAENAEVVSLDTLLERTNSESVLNFKPRVALTFDDGYQTVHDVVAPILQQYGFTGTVYLNTGHIGAQLHEPSNSGLGHYPEEFFMVWDEVISLQSQGWIIGSHGVEHVDLTILDPLKITEQLQKSKLDIFQATGEECRHFSYTWGHHNLKVRTLVAKAGYQAAVAAHHAELGNTLDMFSLPRVDVRQEYAIADFAALLRGEWDFLKTYQALRAAIR